MLRSALLPVALCRRRGAVRGWSCAPRGWPGGGTRPRGPRGLLPARARPAALRLPPCDRRLRGAGERRGGRAGEGDTRVGDTRVGDRPPPPPPPLPGTFYQHPAAEASQATLASVSPVFAVVSAAQACAG